VVDLIECDTVEGYDDFCNRDIVDRWVHTSSGQLISAISGKCVETLYGNSTVGASVEQWDCRTSESFSDGRDKWAFSQGRITSLKQTSMCLTPGQAYPSGNGFSLVLQECKKSSRFSLHSVFCGWPGWSYHVLDHLLSVKRQADPSADHVCRIGV
jgi:hypothetical protein